MKLKLEVVLSTSIKRKKPWPRFCWLGQEKENVFLLDDKRISEINIVSGRTKKKTPKLHQLLNNVVTMATSQNGMWLCGILVSGELFLWNKDKDLLKTSASVPEVVHMITSAQENSTKLCLQVSCDGIRVLLVAIPGQVFLWECTDVRDFAGLRDGPVKGHWAHIHPLEESRLPSSQDKEASQHTIFVKTEVMGDICLSAFVFTSGKQLIITILKIQWKEGHVWVGSVGYSIQWSTRTYPMSHLTPPCHPVKSRGALVPAFSPDGRLLAVVLNQRKPKATQVLFVSSQNFISVLCGLGGCGSKKKDIPPKYIRSYWVGNISWSPGGLFLACVLKRGSLLMLAPLGGLLTLSSSGCSVDFGPAHFLPLHPLVTYRPPIFAGKGEASLSSSSMSVRDILRQRYSVTWHPRLLYLIVSDGYMATVLRVLDKPSPALFLKSLLKDAGKDLEKLSPKLDKSQAHVKSWLESVSCLNLDNSFEELNCTVTRRPKTSDSTVSVATDASRLPLFLQDQQTLGATRGPLGSMQTFLESESDLDGLPAGPHMEDVGRLEFASMFDTLHALETHNETAFLDFDEIEKTPLRRELGRIQRKLLTAWAFGMLLGDDLEHRLPLLKHTLCCVVRFAALLHLLPGSMVHTGEPNTPTFACLLRLIKALLSFLPWGSADRLHCLGLLVEFSKWIVRLLLIPYPESHQTGHLLVSSQSLSHVMLILQLVSDSLDHAYSLKDKTYWSSEEEVSPSQPHVWPSDVYHIPLLQNENTERSSLVHQPLPVPQRPSSRLLGAWQLVCDITQQYAEELTKFRGSDGVKEEEQKLSVIMSHIQSALQATGGNLADGPSLLSYPAEHLFLCGLYSKSADSWQVQICEEANKSCDRSVFQEMRLCLALLYSLLSQYCLKEPQALGDHMAQLILVWAGNREDSLTDHLPCSWLPMNLHLDAAFAVVQTLGRFMASYFTNQPLFILPAHNVAILPPLHLLHVQSADRLVPLCQEDVARSVRQQHLSEVWTVDYALDLLLLGGLLPEAVWLAYHLGDWKTAVTLSLACTSYCAERFDFTQLRRRELHLPAVLRPENIFQAELESLLGNQTYSPKSTVKYDDKSFTDPLDGEDWDLLQASLQEILKASVMAGVNIISSPLCSLLEKAKNTCSSLPTLVPTALYLPSPPLYCPQPSLNTQDQIGTVGQFAEVSCRHEVSGILQRLLVLLRSARCFHPAAQWYISRLRRARHILHKIKKKYSYPSATQEEEAFPEGLVKLITPGGYFKRGPNKDGCLDSDIIQTIICFRELCALCWMLHVRDQLSLHCRKYQAARQHERQTKTSDDSDVNSTCADALLWACRLLPFSHFLSSEEVFQDLLLSLVSELPPGPMVADTLVQAFPQEEESVRVSLREKYKLLLQRLKQSRTFDGGNKKANESMMILFQHKKKQRRKHLARLQRHLAPLVLRLWGKEEDGPSTTGQLSQSRTKQLGTSLSTDTLTDAAFVPVYSDVDTVNSSESVSTEQPCRATTSGKGAKKRNKNVKKSENIIQEKSLITEERKKEQPSLPVIGTWEFELEDEEYLHFLELFLSYVLERDSADGGDPSGELPLLRGFCSELRERELHSLTFDVLTTVHRRQRSEHHPPRIHPSNAPPVFRAGSCYKQNTTLELKTSSPWSEAPISRASPSVSSYPEQRTGKQKGLFGLRQQSDPPSTRVKGTVLVSEASSFTKGFSTGQPSESSRFGSSVSAEAVTELKRGLDPNLEAQFPKLGRLLEWMVRWADKRALLGHHGKKEKDKNDEGVVIRVKVSAPAILTSLSLLECKFTALPQTGRNNSHIPVPEMQWTVTPVLQPEVEKKLERESSVDTGYLGSANTPITGLVHNLQQEQVDSCTDEPEDLMFQRTPSSVDQVELNFNAQQEHASSQQLSFNDLDVTPEKEDRSGDSKSLDALSSGSIEGVSGNVCTPETSLKLEDLDYSERAEHMSNSSSTEHPIPEHPEAPAPPTTQPKTTLHAELSNSSGTPHHNTSVDSPNPPPQNCTVGAPATDPPISNPSLITSPMRQRLGEDLFRLVQHINYMSLSEVLGASFSNLQRAQQSSSVPLPETNSSHPNMQSSSNNNIIPEPNVLPASPQTLDYVPNSRSSDHQLNQIMSHEFADQPVMQSTAKTSSAANQYHANRSANDTRADVNYQEMQPLIVQADSPNIQQRVKRRPIPPSQGLLVTSDSCPAIQNTLPLLLPDDNTQKNCPLEMLGLKLLKLHHPVMSQDNAPHGPQMLHTTNHQSLQSYQPNLKQNYQATWKKKSGEQRNEFSVPTKHLRFDPPRDPTHMNSQTQIWSSGQTIGHVFPLLHPTFSSQTQAPMQGLPLLQLQHVPHSNISFPKLSHPAVFRPAVISAPITGAPMIKLLHIESGPKMMMPQAVPPGQMTHLMSMEELTSSEILRRDAEKTQLQLLSSNPSHENRGTVNSFNSSKRQKRREERAKERKAEVTFRPNESIIPTQEAADVPVSKEPAGAEEINPEQEITGSSDSLLTAQRLLDMAWSTSAELHAFASTSKRPPECHDAFTNTEPASSPLLVDKAVSVQASVMINSPKRQSPCIFHEDPVQNTEKELPHKEDEILDLVGHQFISVLDLEDRMQYGALPSCISPEAQDVPSSPSSAHVLATSVIRAATESQTPDTIQVHPPKPTTSTDTPVESPLFSHCEPRGVLERITPRDCMMVDSSDSEICGAIKAQSLVPDGSSSSPPVWFSSHLTELDAQLAALKNIADHLEMDFSNSRMLVKKTEKRSSTVAPKVTTPVKKTVRLSVPLKAWIPRPGSDHFTKLKSCEEDEEELEPPRHDSTSPFGQRDPPSYLHSSPGLKDHFSETYEILHELADENLGQSELSDTAEILDELVKEGYLSPTDWNRSTYQTERQSCRQDQQQRSWKSQKHAPPDGERKELRIWMRRKQRERLAAYQKHRTNLRETEHKPFCPPPTRRSANRTHATPGGARDEKERIMLQYNQRTREACSLAADFLNSPENVLRSSQTFEAPFFSTTRQISAPLPGNGLRSQTVCVSNKRNPKSQSGPAHPHHRPQSVEERHSQDLHRRLGLYRPVTFLPGDRLSQVTRRGMLSNTKSPSKHHAAGQSEGQRVGFQRTEGLNRTFSSGAALDRQIPKKHTQVEEMDCSESRRLHGLMESDMVLTELLGTEDDAVAGGVSEMDWLDNLSDSAGSSLSKIDWAAIERMVAEEEVEHNDEKKVP